MNSTNSSKPSENIIPTGNEVAAQSSSETGPAPFTQSVETAAVMAPAPTSAPASPAAGATATGLHSVQGSSAGLYAGTMSKPACDTEKLISMTSTGDTGRAWSSAQGIQQSAIPGYMRSLTSAYLRVDTRVTNHAYKGGAAVAYQSVLQAGTAVLVDSQGVPRVRCGCGNPLKPPVLVPDAKYTGKTWTGFQPSALIVVVAAPQPVKEFILVNVATGGWFARVTGQIKVEDRTVPPPKELAPGIPPAEPMKPASPSGSGPASGSTSATTSGSGSASGSTGPSSGSASASTSSGKPSGPSSSASTATSTPTTATATATPSSATAKPTTATATATTATATATTATATTTTTGTSTATGTTTAATAACATVLPSTLPPCPTASGGGSS
ncbi:DUF6777 domain-containing protein [Kitasatospora sp. NPDC047058]|uniref:DUF6777 domain-containing protein n=1 Tax=Kitasatospora sp. NPDC047058 TaxID=3155620 RepID=UPI0033FF17C5